MKFYVHNLDDSLIENVTTMKNNIIDDTNVHMHEMRQRD